MKAFVVKQVHVEHLRSSKRDYDKKHYDRTREREYALYTLGSIADTILRYGSIQVTQLG